MARQGWLWGADAQELGPGRQQGQGSRGHSEIDSGGGEEDLMRDRMPGMLMETKGDLHVLGLSKGWNVLLFAHDGMMQGLGDLWSASVVLS